MSDPLQEAIVRWAEDATRERADADQIGRELASLASTGIAVRFNDPERLIGVFPGNVEGVEGDQRWCRYLHVLLVTHERAADRRRFGLSGAAPGMWEWMLVLAPEKARCAAAFLDRGAERTRMLAVKSAVESWCVDQLRPSPVTLRVASASA